MEESHGGVRSRISQVMSLESSKQLPKVLNIATPNTSPRIPADWTSSLTPPERGAADGRTIECPDDLKLMCRVVGMHCRAKLQVGQSLLLNEAGACQFKLAASVETGYNLKCLVFEEEMEQFKRRRRCDLEKYPASENRDSFSSTIANMPHSGKHLIFAFNWFSPKGVWDYVNLGLQLLTDTSLCRRHPLLGSVYVDKAEDFLWDAQIIRLFESLNVGSAESALKLITMTGFSLGGAIAHAFAYLLREVKRFQTPLRVIGLGCPRPGTPALTRWFHRELMSDSCSIFLYDEIPEESAVRTEYDPAVMSPPLADGYDYHPNAFALHRRFGTIRPFTKEERTSLSENQEGAYRSSVLKAFMQSVSRERNRLWAEYHGILKYYESMYGLP